MTNPISSVQDDDRLAWRVLVFFHFEMILLERVDSRHVGGSPEAPAKTVVASQCIVKALESSKITK